MKVGVTRAGAPDAHEYLPAPRRGHGYVLEHWPVQP